MTAPAPLPTRLRAFFRARWPLLPNLLGAAALVVSLSFTAQAALGRAGLVVGLQELFAFLLAAGTSLLMRAYDELKDVETDLKLAASGDALFADRPIATGAVLPADLVLLKNIALPVFTLGAAGALWRSSAPLWTAALSVALLGTVWFSSRWFFWPRVQRDLLLAFLTHNPIAGVVGAALVASLARGSLPPLVTAALIASSWFPIGAWEVARKLRAPADETAYETYSRRLGVGRAALLATTLAALSLGALVILAKAAAASPWYLAVASASAGLLIVGAAAYAWRPTSRSAKLRPLAEQFALVATAGLPVALALSHGVRWEGVP